MLWVGMGKRVIYFFLLYLLFAGSQGLLSLQAKASSVPERHIDDYWDEEVQPAEVPSKPAVEVPVEANTKSVKDPDSKGPESSSRPVQRSLLRQALASTHPLREGLLLAFVVYFIFNIVQGRRTNKRIAVAWTKSFCDQGQVLERNFAQLGFEYETGSLLTRESASNFKLFASGRRFCQSLTASLDLRKRQDLLHYAVSLVSPGDDQLQIDVEMNEANMPPLVLAIAPPKTARALLRDEENKELEELTHKIEVSRERFPAWPSDKLTVLAEHSSNLYDVIPDQLMEQVFSKAAFETHGRYFRSLLFSSERKSGHKHLLRFCFILPPAEAMDELARWLAAVMVLIDVIGTYKLSPEQKKRADKARADIEHRAWKDLEKDRQQAMEDRKETKRKEEQERLRKMDPEAREKLQERKAKVQQKRAMRARIIRA